MKDPGSLNPAGPAPPCRYDGFQQSGGRTLILVLNVVSGLCFQADEDPAESSRSEDRSMQTEEDASRTDPDPVTVSISVHQ